MIIIYSALALSLLLLSYLAYNVYKQEKSKQNAQHTLSDLAQLMQQSQDKLTAFQEKLLKEMHSGQISNLKHLQEALYTGMNRTRLELSESLVSHSKQNSDNFDKLTLNVEKRLKEISGQVEKRLNEGFEKTTQTFTDVIKRLALIDEAQKKITELSSNVVSLQSILDDKRTRGAFGEVQLNALIRNVLPESHIAFQHTLSNKKRVDCLLKLPEPTGHIAIDAKFPLENFRKIMELTPTDTQKKLLETQFRQDIKKHINDIAERYIVPGETSDGAVMFIPAEAIFSTIHTDFPELIDYSHQMKVWMVSPTTMMAIITTAKAVLKDAATRKQVHIIQKHLGLLAKDFTRFQKRMDNLARHIQQANDDVSDVSTSAKKITSRFTKIEQVELDDTTEKEGLLEAMREE